MSEPESESEVGLAHFAAIGGMTEQEFSKKFFDTLEDGRLMFLLKVEAQVDLLEWVAEVNPLDGEQEFLVSFRTSLNSARDSAIHCVCTCSGERFPTINVRHATHGFMDSPPVEADDLEGFEVNLCDMEATLP